MQKSLFPNLSNVVNRPMTLDSKWIPWNFWIFQIFTELSVNPTSINQCVENKEIHNHKSTFIYIKQVLFGVEHESVIQETIIQ